MTTSPEVLGPRYVARQLQAAEQALTNAQAATEDRLVADACAHARKEVRGAVTRSRRLLEAAGGVHQLDIEPGDPTHG